MKIKQLKNNVINKKFMYVIKKVKTNEYLYVGIISHYVKNKNNATIFYGKEKLNEFLNEFPEFKVGRFYRICTIGSFFDNFVN